MEIRKPLEITRLYPKTKEHYCGLLKYAYEVNYKVTVDQMKGIIRGNNEDLLTALSELERNNIMIYKDDYISFKEFPEPSVDLPYWALCRIFEDRGEKVGRLLKFYILAIGVLDKEKKIWDWDDFKVFEDSFKLARCIGLGIVEYIPRDGKSWFRIPERED